MAAALGGITPVCKVRLDEVRLTHTVNAAILYWNGALMDVEC